MFVFRPSSNAHLSCRRLGLVFVIREPTARENDESHVKLCPCGIVFCVHQDRLKLSVNKPSERKCNLLITEPEGFNSTGTKYYYLKPFHCRTNWCEPKVLKTRPFHNTKTKINLNYIETS
jgi:hypothetical protein